MNQSPQVEIHRYGDPTLPTTACTSNGPVNAMVLTSVRDVGTCDRNGLSVQTPEGPRHMEGIVERIITETNEGGRLSGIMNLVGVVTDDLERDMRNSDYSPYPTTDNHWIHDRSLRNEAGELVASEDMTHWVPSNFRALPLRETEKREQQKEQFEARVLELMQQRNADVLISDHYMARIAYMIQSRYGKFGRVLNIHPAITNTSDPYCFRGPTPTQDAIDRAAVDSETVTGATLHFVNEVIDDGPQIAYATGTPVSANDEPQHLRYRNYQMAKLPLFIEGMRHYFQEIYPHLDKIDLNNLVQLNGNVSS